MNWREKLKTFKPFSEREAWILFTIAAIGEAVGWSCLIIGVVARHYHLHGYAEILPIVGQIHGTLFICYLGVIITGFNSLNWSLKRTAIAVLASVPPYGTLMFEQWAVRNRRQALRRSYRRIVVRGIISKGKTILANQPNDSTSWSLPGGYIEAGETAEQAITRTLCQLTGITPKVGPLRYIVESTHHRESRLEFYFHIANAQAFHALDLKTARVKNPSLEEIDYVIPRKTPDLEPAFLRTMPFAKLIDLNASRPLFISSK